MMETTNSYAVLGLEESATESDVRQRYLELVRQFPPDRSPERFAEIRAAYDDLRDPIRKLRARLFDYRGAPTIDEVIVRLHRGLDPRQIPLGDILFLAGQP